MDNQEKEIPFTNPFSENWMDAASKFWENTLKMQMDAVESMYGFTNYFNSKSTRSKTENFFKLGSSINKFVFSFFSNPGNLGGFASASEIIPALAMNMANNLTASIAEIQGILAQKSSKLGGDFKELDMDEFNTGIFTIWKELYQSDFQKFYNIPQLGLARNYQEQINVAMDKGNRFFMELSEFMNLLLVPVEKAGAFTLEAYQKMVDDKKISDDPKNVYKLWLKTLEGLYMQLLQSNEYQKVLNSVINTHAEYKKATGKILEMVYHQLQIPTNKELDELYREIYYLKRKLRRVEKENREVNNKPVKKAAVKPKTTAKKKKAKTTTKKTNTTKKAKTSESMKDSNTKKTGK